LDERIKAYEKNPDDLIDWEDFIEELEKRL
jgi:hypothetical protein